MFAVAVLLLLGGIVPEVRDPWPSSIGLDFPFTLAGAFGVLGDVFCGESSQGQRDRLVRRVGVLGFLAGAFLYFLALLNQVTLGL